jgi:hypothetical protein
VAKKNKTKKTKKPVAKKNSASTILEYSEDSNLILATGTTLEVIGISSIGDPDDVLEIDTEIITLERSRKKYWPDKTEKAVVEFLKHDFNYYETKLERYISQCAKKKISIDNDYINELQEKIDWASTSEITNKKDEIYNKYIHKPLNKLVENIIFKFGLFIQGVDVKTTHGDCLTFVYSKFVNFNPEKNTKSFSYFGTIAKNYLMGEKKDSNKGSQVNLDYDDHRDEADEREILVPHEKSDHEKSLTLFNHVIKNMEKEIELRVRTPEDKRGLTDNDIKVADAIVNICKNHELIGAYNKNHVYHLIKEYTGLQTKDITYSLARYRVFYRLLKQEFVKNNTNKD